MVLGYSLFLCKLEQLTILQMLYSLLSTVFLLTAEVLRSLAMLLEHLKHQCGYYLRKELWIHLYPLYLKSNFSSVFAGGKEGEL